MADQNLIKNHEFLDDEFDVFKQDDIEQQQYQQSIVDPSHGMGLNNYSHSMIYTKNLPINQNMLMQQVQKTVADYSDEEQDDNYKAIKCLTGHYQTQHDQDHVEDQWNGQIENQGEEYQDDINIQIIHSGEGNMNKAADVNGSTETMINKYTSNNLVFSGSNSLTKEQQNGNNNMSTKGKTLMGSSIIAGVGAPLDQSNISQGQQQLTQNQQKSIQSSQSLQNSKQGFKMIKKEKNNNLLSSSSLLQPKSMTNIEQQQMGAVNLINNNNSNNSQFLQQNHQNNLGVSDYRDSLNNNNNLRQSINNGLGDSSILMSSINNGIQLRTPAQSMQYNDVNQFYNKNEFKQNQNYLGSSLVNPQQEQILREQQSFQQEDQQIQQHQSTSLIQQQQQQLLQNDNNILNKVKSEDCSSTNEQQPINQINGANSTHNNINSSITAPLNNNPNSNNSQTISPQIPTQMVTPPHQTTSSAVNNQSGHFSYKQKGSNASTAEIKRPTKKVEVVTPNQSQMSLHHSQNHQQQLLPPPPPQQLHSQFQQNFLSQIPNGLGYPNPNQPPAAPPQQAPYGYPYAQPPQAQPQQFASQQASKGFMPPHYGANPHLSSSYNQYLEQQHQQNILPAIQNPYSQELENMQFNAFLQPPFQPGGPQQPNPAQAQGPGYDYMNPGFNGLSYNAYNQNYPQHQPPNQGLAVHQPHHLFQHIPQINQQNGFNPAFPLGLRPQNANLATSSHDLNSQQFSHVQSSQNGQISQFKIKEEALQKGMDEKNSSSSQNNNNYQNGSLLPPQNLGNSNQIAPALNGAQNQNLQSQYNLLQGPNQYAQMMLPKQGQQLLQFQEGLNGQANMQDPLQQASNALKLAQNQQFLGAQLNQFNTQHQQQQFLKQNQLLQQQQLKVQQQQQQSRLVTNNNLDEESRENDDEEDDNANSDGNGEQEVNNSGKPKRPKNETKNIPKNYAKAFLRYIIDKDRVDEMKKILRQIDANLEYDDIKKEAKNFKKNMNAIKDVRKIWQDDTNERTRSISKFMRIASHQFLQKEAISYIFSSNKIKNSKSHIIYRHVMGLAMADPEKFNNIKSLYKNAYQE
ncbi:hypothetical protein ABPG74_017492 [Tetrahymena malaccensis]